MKSIDIKETINDKDTWFNIKRLNLEGLNDDVSVKTFDLSNLTQELTSPLDSRCTIFEKSKLIRLLRKRITGKLRAFLAGEDGLMRNSG